MKDIQLLKCRSNTWIYFMSNYGRNTQTSRTYIVTYVHNIIPVAFWGTCDLQVANKKLKIKSIHRITIKRSKCMLGNRYSDKFASSRRPLSVNSPYRLEHLPTCI